MDDIAQVDANPHTEAELRGNAGLALRHAALDRDGTGNRVDRAAEHAQNAVVEVLRAAQHVPSSSACIRRV